MIEITCNNCNEKMLVQTEELIVCPYCEELIELQTGSDSDQKADESSERKEAEKPNVNYLSNEVVNTIRTKRFAAAELERIRRKRLREQNVVIICEACKEKKLSNGFKRILKDSDHFAFGQFVCGSCQRMHAKNLPPQTRSQLYLRKLEANRLKQRRKRGRSNESIIPKDKICLQCGQEYPPVKQKWKRWQDKVICTKCWWANKLERQRKLRKASSENKKE